MIISEVSMLLSSQTWLRDGDWEVKTVSTARPAGVHRKLEAHGGSHPRPGEHCSKKTHDALHGPLSRDPPNWSPHSADLYVLTTFLFFFVWFHSF
jgi:hypothetical protein